MIGRRAALGGAATLLSRPALADDIEPMAEGLRSSLSALERRHGGRLGVAILYADRRPVIVTQRGAERFPFCSTYKVLAAALVLARVDKRQDTLSRRVAYRPGDLVPFSPVTEMHVADGMTLGALCEAAVCLSDNTAGNLLLDSFGGPAPLTAFLRALGDGVSRLDRREPDLNEAAPGDERDTTTPAAMAHVLHRTVLGDALSPASRAQLAAWLVGSRTGDKRIRAGVPPGWRVGDKTGSGAHNTTNDVAVLWPPRGAARKAPRVVTVFYADAAASDEERDAVLAEVGRLASA